MSHARWGALITFARKTLEKRQGLLERLLSERPAPASPVVNGIAFVDAAFTRPFQKGQIVFASLSGALVELETLDALREKSGAASVDDDIGCAIAAFRRGASLARAASLPLVVDA